MAFKLFDYQSSGKGVSKSAPQKKPFFKYWEIFGRKFWKLSRPGHKEDGVAERPMEWCKSTA